MRLLIKTVKFVPEFDENGNLPYNCYEISLHEFESKFSEGLSDKRKYIMDMYKIQLNKIHGCGYELNHWVYGSYVSNNEPDDIDTLTEFDGKKCDQDNIKNYLQDMIDKAPLYTDYCCHSWRDRIYQFLLLPFFFVSQWKKSL